MSYFDGFVAAVPLGNRDAYVEHAKDFWERVLKPAGAVATAECWADDVPDGEVTSFPMAVKATADEAVVFTWVEWPDKATREACWAAMMAGDVEMGEMPFDGKRMIFGGFAPLIHERA